MSISKPIIAAVLVGLTSCPAMAENFLVHIHTGPDNPTKAALGFLVALTAQNEGHHVDMFLAGDGASLITDDALSSVAGVGTGKLQDHFTALIQGDARIYISGMSAKARDITEVELEGKPAEFAMPTKLVELAAAADVVLAY
jgi:predicted peroxiredoxin